LPSTAIFPILPNHSSTSHRDITPMSSISHMLRTFIRVLTSFFSGR
jgi:hypothetical protein